MLLTAVALVLGRINLNLLIGTQADPRLVADVRARLGAAPEIDWVVDIVTVTFGADRVLVCARLDFRDALTAAGVERACVRPATCATRTRRSTRSSSNPSPGTILSCANASSRAMVGRCGSSVRSHDGRHSGVTATALYAVRSLLGGPRGVTAV